MGFTYVLIVALAAIACFIGWIARNPKGSQESFAQRSEPELHPGPEKEKQHLFQQKATREQWVSQRLPQPYQPAPDYVASPDNKSELGAEDRQRRLDRLRAIREAHRPKLIGDLEIPLEAALSAWLPETFVVLDLETTGLSPGVDEIIEIGAIRATLGAKNHATFQTLVTPRREISQEASRINGITPRMADRDGRPADQSLREFSKFIGNLPLVTFNAPFDMGFLWSTGERYGVEIKNRYTCALQLSRRAWPSLSSHRLQDLARWTNLPADNTHRALDDSKRALQIFVTAVSTIGERVRWEYHPLDCDVTAQYNIKRDANRAFCAETRHLEATNLAQAVSRYTEAMERMYEYEAKVDGRYADAFILDRFTLCLWKSERYNDLVDAVDRFAGRFPEVESSLMTTVLKRRDRAKSKLIVAQVNGPPDLAAGSDLTMASVGTNGRKTILDAGSHLNRH